MMSSLKFEPEVICPDNPSPATGEGNGVGADAPWHSKSTV